ncbi:MAG: GDP-mannose 4,6-dehydratase [Sandarakinorhabdus sp.]|nr:GDP-mannose 4,6-dehydratase [Sandarakinorhabdus sp.]
MPNALILGSNTAVGAYLARLLHARGTAVFGVASPGGGDGITALGIADSVNAIGFAVAIDLAARLPDATLFAVNSGDPTTAEQAAELYAAASADARLCHIADADALRQSPLLLDQARAIAALRRDHGRRAVNAILHAHDSRLGPADGLPARITLAAWRAANGWAPATPLALVETGPRDWGWTAEYVDAIARLAALDRPIDLAIGSGHRIDTGTMVNEAFGFFKLRPEGHVTVSPGAAVTEPDIDTARLKAATGWSASTWGRDLVHALCEGAAARAADQ